MRGAVTFDFHNTLAHSDAWFDLEVRHLVSAFLGWRGEQRGRPADPATMVAADAAYQRLRREIVAHGREVAAEAGVEQVLAELGEPVDPAEVRRGVRA
jgi:hypothetical protein